MEFLLDVPAATINWAQVQQRPQKLAEGRMNGRSIDYDNNYAVRSLDRVHTTRACLYSPAVEMMPYPVFVNGRLRREGTGCTGPRGPKG
ncbi:MAG: hypothetical protein KTR25_02805 [Myxococcales bacterium]|nr:hypothetical protein [Myxococcales bacterium]